MIGPYYITTDARRRAAWGKPGVANNPDVLAGTVTIDGRRFRCHRLAVEPFEHFEKIRAHHGYRLTGSDTGFYSYRHMRNDPNKPLSAHSWAMVLDINWLENPAGNKLITDIPRAMIDDLLALRTNSDARVFRWGGDWDWDGVSTDQTYIDAMHWECVAHPLDLATGIAPYQLSVPEEVIMLGFNIGPPGAAAVRDPRAEALQIMLLDRGEQLPQWGADGSAGDETRAALASYQTKHDVADEPGLVGPKTYAALHASAGVSLAQTDARYVKAGKPVIVRNA